MSIKRVTQGQGSLFPPHLGDLVPPDHPVRLISDLVDTAGVQDFIDDYGTDGAPGFPPDLMLKVLIYAYSTGMRSTRRIAEATRYNNLFRWLAGEITPDYRTFWLFQKRHRERIARFMARMTQLLVEIGRVDLVNWVVDGTKVRAAASARSLVSPDEFRMQVVAWAEAGVHEVMAQIEARDAEEDGEPDPGGGALQDKLADRATRLEAIRAAAARIETSRARKPRGSATEPETVVVSPSEAGAGPGYNVQIAMDVSSKLIVACDVVTDPTDNAHLIPLLDAAIASAGAQPEHVLADAGYTSSETLAALESRGIVALVPQLGEDQQCEEDEDVPVHPQTGVPLATDHHGNIRWTEFAAETGMDGAPIRRCPDGRVLRGGPHVARHRKTGVAQYRVYRSSDCTGCGLAHVCLSAPRGSPEAPLDERPPRRVYVPDREALIRENSARLRSEDGAARYRLRMSSIEPKNADLKRNAGLRRLTTWGRAAAKASVILACIGVNAKRLAAMGVAQIRSELKNARTTH